MPIFTGEQTSPRQEAAGYLFKGGAPIPVQQVGGAFGKVTGQQLQQQAKQPTSTQYYSPAVKANLNPFYSPMSVPSPFSVQQTQARQNIIPMSSNPPSQIQQPSPFQIQSTPSQFAQRASPSQEGQITQRVISTFQDGGQQIPVVEYYVTENGQQRRLTLSEIKNLQYVEQAKTQEQINQEKQQEYTSAKGFLGKALTVLDLAMENLYSKVEVERQQAVATGKESAYAPLLGAATSLSQTYQFTKGLISEPITTIKSIPKSFESQIEFVTSGKLANVLLQEPSFAGGYIATELATLKAVGVGQDLAIAGIKETAKATGKAVSSSFRVKSAISGVLDKDYGLIGKPPVTDKEVLASLERYQKKPILNKPIRTGQPEMYKPTDKEVLKGLKAYAGEKPIYAIDLTSGYKEALETSAEKLAKLKIIDYEKLSGIDKDFVKTKTLKYLEGKSKELSEINKLAIERLPKEKPQLKPIEFDIDISEIRNKMNRLKSGADYLEFTKEGWKIREKPEVTPIKENIVDLKLKQEEIPEVRKLLLKRLSKNYEPIKLKSIKNVANKEPLRIIRQTEFPEVKELSEPKAEGFNRQQLILEKPILKEKLIPEVKEVRLIEDIKQIKLADVKEPISISKISLPNAESKISSLARQGQGIYFKDLTSSSLERQLRIVQTKQISVSKGEFKQPTVSKFQYNFKEPVSLGKVYPMQKTFEAQAQQPVARLSYPKVFAREFQTPRQIARQRFKEPQMERLSLKLRTELTKVQKKKKTALNKDLGIGSSSDLGYDVFKIVKRKPVLVARGLSLGSAKDVEVRELLKDLGATAFLKKSNLPARDISTGFEAEIYGYKFRKPTAKSRYRDLGINVIVQKQTGRGGRLSTIGEKRAIRQARMNKIMRAIA